MKADILRQKFLDFFKAKRHKVIESDSLVPKDDPTVLFTPAGMSQFKKQFLGHTTGFKRAATSQRCLRTDDLDKVGKTPSHHTFFEMLGNFSFGDYFKEEAIAFAWEFLTQELKIKEEKLWVSVYKDDGEAYKIWKDKIKIPQDKIIKLGDKENFWPSEAKTKGPNGPCGPCSEIFFDHNGESVEVWNLVFTQFNRKEGGILEPLPRKNIDTGMGLERLAAVMQGTETNFGTEIFQPIIKEIAANAGLSPKNEFIYAIADHIRAIVFAIYDGVLPSNEERGYIVRKLIRRSALHLRNIGVDKPFLYKLVPVVSEIMRVPYPELSGRRENIAEIILTEEKNFLATFQSSDALLEDKFREFLGRPDPIKAGRVAFVLYDTYGIPLELTWEWLNKHNIQMSREAFNRELEAQKSRSKLQSAMKGDVFDIKELHLGAGQTHFLGYGKYETKAKIIKIIKDSAVGGSALGGNLPVHKITKGETAKIILDKTVFYPESGGQVGDTGEFIKGKNIFQVTDTQRVGKVIVHQGMVKEGSFKAKGELKAVIDVERRLSTARNHTATHLLQAALRRVLGAHVKQQGSLVTFDRLRFDFTHFKDISQNEIARIEGLVNDYIINNAVLATKTVSVQEAKKQGALAFFREKYAEKVRLVSIGGFSKELCGGTHLGSTAGIGLFKITQESAIASGIRRIEAVTATFAYKLFKENENIVSGASSILNVSPEKATAELEKRLSRLKELERLLNQQKLESVKNSLDDLIQNAEQVNAIKVITHAIQNADMNLLRNTMDLIKQKAGSAVIALGTTNADKALLVLGITPDLCAKGLDAAKLIADIANVIGGNGGGRKDFAQAGGNRPQDLEKAFARLKDMVADWK